jgi:parvulin-like peptidyl-prolyl isomerase
MKSLAILLMSTLVVGSAAAQQGARTPARPPAANAAGGLEAPSKLDKTEPALVVNGDAIPVATYIDRLSLEFGPQVIQALMDEQLIRQEARRRGLSVSNPEIREAAANAYSESVRRFGGEEALAEELQSGRGWNLADYRSALHNGTGIQLLRDKLIADVVKESDLTDAEVAAQYEANRQQFAQPESVRVSHILIRREGGRATEDPEARARAQALLDSLRGANPPTFEELARNHSEDRLSGQGGGVIPADLPRGAHPFGAAFEAAVYGSEPGLVGEVVASPDGYHVIRVDSRKEARVLPLAEVRDQLRAHLLAERRGQALEELLVRLRSDAKVERRRF